MNLPVSQTRSFSDDELDIIKTTVAKGATDDELKLFLYYCATQNLNPLAKDVYFTKRNGKNGATTAYITSIDTYRSRAEDTGCYAGNDDPVFDDEQNPKKASVTVYKLVGGVRCPFTATARWDQYYPGDLQGFMWRKMPHLMLGKCAEALALRKAFPKQYKGLYIKEEMQQAGSEASTTSVNLPTVTSAQSVSHETIEPEIEENFEPVDNKKLCTACGLELLPSKYGGGWYCKNYKDRTKEHTIIKG